MKTLQKIITLVTLIFVQVTFSQSNPQTVYKGPIIDMHAHAFSQKAESMFFGIPHPETLRGETFMSAANEEELRNKTLEMYKKHNVVLSVVKNGHLWKDADPDRILIGRYELPIEELEALHLKGELQVIGEMAPFYGGIQADDQSQKAYFELAERLNIPVGFHILPGGPNFGLHLMPEMLGDMRAANANPMQLEQVLINHPKLKIYIMHAAWPYLEDLKALMYMHPNLYVEVAVLNWVLPEMECHKFIKGLVDAGFGKRIMYGSDQMSWPQVIEKGIDTINNADFLTIEQKADIFYNNAARFLELTEEQNKKHHQK